MVRAVIDITCDSMADLHQALRVILEEMKDKEMESGEAGLDYSIRISEIGPPNSMGFASVTEFRTIVVENEGQESQP